MNKTDTSTGTKVVAIKNSVQQTKDFLTRALKLWGTHGYDKKFGGYFEALNFEGVPLVDLDKRFRIHPRTIFAHSAGSYWGYYDGAKVADAAFRNMIEKYWQNDGGFATLTNRENKILDHTVYTYDHAFVMLGLGWLYKISDNLVHRMCLHDTWDMLNTRLIHSKNGFVTSVPEPTTGPMRLQNPHMHMLEAMLNLVELFNEDIWRKAAKDLFELCEKYFVCPHEKKLREFFNDNWEPDTFRGELLEPGHHYEWVWILQKYETLMNTKIDFIEALYDFARAGTNAMGLGYNQTDYNANPTNSNHRMWIQTEIIKANISMYRRSLNKRYIDEAYHAWKTLFSRYLIIEHATWYDELDEQGKNISSNAPTSTLYHVIIALHEYICFADSL